MLTVHELLRRSEDHLRATPDSHIEMVWRIRLWAAMKAQYPRSSLFRRAVLAYMVARRTLAAWDALVVEGEESFRELPHQMLQDCRLLIRRQIASEDARRIESEDREHEWMLFGSVFGSGGYAILAVDAALDCASSWEETVCRAYYYPHVWKHDFFERVQDAGMESGQRDTHFWAACAAAGIPPSAYYRRFESSSHSETYDRDAALAFWLHWLHEDVPSVLGHMREVRRLLDAA